MSKNSNSSETWNDLQRHHKIYLKYIDIDSFHDVNNLLFEYEFI